MPENRFYFALFSTGKSINLLEVFREMDNEQIRAFEDFQKHHRHEKQEYEVQRAQLRNRVLGLVPNTHPLYRYRNGGIEPVFTVADQHFLRTVRVFA